MAGFDTVTVKSTPAGFVDMDDLARQARQQTAVFMITNPNTLGMFDRHIADIADAVHDAGGLVYLDGANMNAILGIARPGDFGADMMHFNPHKTFSGPHGGGGPGPGPIAVTSAAGRRTCRCRAVGRAGGQLSAGLRSPPIDRPRAQLLRQRGRAGAGLLLHPHARARRPASGCSENAVLNANYLLSRVKHILPVPQGDRCMHEFVASAARLKAERGISAMDIAKRLLDYGFHAPTVYFPPIVKEAMMIEPTETESKETLDAFAETLFAITDEPADCLHEAPHSTPDQPARRSAAPRGSR